MSGLDDPSKIAVHAEPVWRDRANFLIHVKLEGDRWEQLWTKQLSENRFEICCIPFFAYDMALGDEVETEEHKGAPYVVKSVVKDAGQYTFRVWFGGISGSSGHTHAHQDIHHELLARLLDLGCLHEWSSDDLLAVSVGAEAAQAVADYLWEAEQTKSIEYETGRKTLPNV